MRTTELPQRTLLPSAQTPKQLVFLPLLWGMVPMLPEQVAFRSAARVWITAIRAPWETIPSPSVRMPLPESRIIPM